MNGWKWYKILKSQAGVAMIEFAVGLPILILMLFGSVELTRYILINQKLDKATNSLDDLATRQISVSDEFMNQLTTSMPKFLRPFSFSDSNTQVVFTFVRREAAPQRSTNRPPAAKVTRQYSRTPGAISRSRIGAVGANANLPNGFTMEQKENVIVVESFYDFKSILGDTFLPSRELYKVAVMRPRIEQSFCPTGCRPQGSPPDDTSNGCFQRPVCPPPPCNVKCPPTFTVTPPNCNLDLCPCVCLPYEGAPLPTSCNSPPEPPPEVCPPICKDCLRSWQTNHPDCPPADACPCTGCRPSNEPPDANCPDRCKCCYPSSEPPETRPAACQDKPTCPLICPYCYPGGPRCTATETGCDCDDCPSPPHQ